MGYPTLRLWDTDTKISIRVHPSEGKLTEDVPGQPPHPDW